MVQVHFSRSERKVTDHILAGKTRKDLQLFWNVSQWRWHMQWHNFSFLSGWSVYQHQNKNLEFANIVKMVHKWWKGKKLLMFSGQQTRQGISTMKQSCRAVRQKAKHNLYSQYLAPWEFLLFPKLRSFRVVSNIITVFTIFDQNAVEFYDNHILLTIFASNGKLFSL